MMINLDTAMYNDVQEMLLAYLCTVTEQVKSPYVHSSQVVDQPQK